MQLNVSTSADSSATQSVQSGVINRLLARRTASHINNMGGNSDPCKINHLKPYAETIDDQICSIDWLRATTKEKSDFEGLMSDLEGIFSEVGFEIVWRDKGLYGYSESANIVYTSGDDSKNVGHIGRSTKSGNTGGMLDLTGMACKTLQVEHPELWLELYSLLNYYEWRFTRLDVALDLTGEYALEHGLTVPSLYKSAVTDGLFRSENVCNPTQQQSFNTAGDWSPLLVGGITPESYDPRTNCAKGLTFYVGNRKSSDFYCRIYEKGKESAGGTTPNSDDMGWIRIEVEWKRGGSNGVIPLDAMLRPDEYFCADRPKAREILDDLRKRAGLGQSQAWKKELFSKERTLLITKKMYWAKHSYGRLLRTLTDEGLTPDQIIDELMRETGLKEHIFDIEEPEL